jgi:NDP-sugar pyrophosphorylase family protein
MAINTHHLPDRFASVLPRLPIEVRVVHEAHIRGTAGGVRGLGLTTSRGLVWNGDIYARPPITALLERAREVPMVLAVQRRPVGEGTVGLNGTRLVRLRGERFGTETSGGDYVGVLALGKRALEALPEVGCLFDDLALPALRTGSPFVETVDTDQPWSDIGTPRAYLELNLAWLAEQELDSWIAPDARVSTRVEAHACIVGRNAVVEGSGALERVVIWPNAVARAPLSDAIVTQNAIVAVTR